VSDFLLTNACPGRRLEEGIERKVGAEWAEVTISASLPKLRTRVNGSLVGWARNPGSWSFRFERLMTED
jgi:hypothetical protein